MDRYLAHVLGYYDFLQAPQVFAHAGENYSLEAVLLHEQAHQALTERSTVGALLSLKAEDLKKADGHDTLREWTVSALTQQIKLVQEGLATYAESTVMIPKFTDEQFIAELTARPDPVYREGYAIAKRMERIFSEESMPEFSAAQLRALRYITLLDISRFALNVPIPRSDDNAELVAVVRENSPNARWQSMLSSLAEDEESRLRFLSKCKPLFAEWLQKSATRFDGDTYNGITYGDNVEPILRELFPALPYQPPLEAWFIRVGRKGPERVEEYVLREWTAELALHPRTELSFVKFPIADFCAGIRRLAAAPGGACYIRIVPAFGPEERTVPVSFDLPLRPGSAAVFFHEARLSQGANGGIWWNYQGEGFVTVISLDAIDDLLHAASWPDAVTVVDVSLKDANRMRVLHWSDIKAPLFVKTSPTGSVAAIAETISDPEINDGASIVMMANWTHFQGAGSDQVFLVWILPDRSEGASVVHFTSEPALNHLQIWLQRAAPAIRIVTGKSRIDLPPRTEDGHAWRVNESETLYAPINADTATAHLLSFGW